jgi:hypothetical protein
LDCVRSLSAAPQFLLFPSHLDREEPRLRRIDRHAHPVAFRFAEHFDPREILEEAPGIRRRWIASAASPPRNDDAVSPQASAYRRTKISPRKSFSPHPA